ELIRPYTIGKLEGVSKSAAFGTIVVERIIDTFSFLILVAIMPLVYDGPLRETFPWLEDARIWISVVTLAGLVFIVSLVVRRDWADDAIRVMSRILPARIREKLHRLSHSFLDGFLFLKKPKNFALIFGQSIAVWFLYICMVYAAFFAFNLDLDFGAAIVVQTISSIGIAVPTPGGTGSYHVFASQTLTQLFGVSSEVALSYATVTHGFGFIGTMIIGLYYFFKDHLKVSEAVAEPVHKTAEV
ncbi:MAG: flippase-like domain-containing protein, partial [Ignavibacteriae bacterium]|nr:flippase-like domain-containing protein [Ignavibacteriota bacterium]